MTKKKRKKESNLRTIKEGDLFYLGGHPTKVKVIRYATSKKPLCEVIERSPWSKYQVGDRIAVFKRLLYPRMERK